MTREQLLDHFHKVHDWHGGCFPRERWVSKDGLIATHDALHADSPGAIARGTSHSHQMERS
jgi:hypothetical protein